MREAEVVQIAEMMDRAMINRENREMLVLVANEVSELCKKFPLRN
jgi:glycine/serine hydroxymethyltransferase